MIHTFTIRRQHKCWIRVCIHQLKSVSLRDKVRWIKEHTGSEYGCIGVKLSFNKAQRIGYLIEYPKT